MAKKYAYFGGFTLAEVMIVLTVIGVLTAILLPVARQSMPDENLMKFKKAHNTLGTVIRELVTSDKYYSDGQLSKLPNGDSVDSPTYLCETIADVLNVKKNNCSESIVDALTNSYVHFNINSGYEAINYLDTSCVNSPAITEQIILANNVVFYETMPAYHFNSDWTQGDGETYKLFTGHYGDTNRFNAIYKIYCIDIDGINKGEAPFGYGIRVDGKILTGARADEWLAREVNED